MNIIQKMVTIIITIIIIIVILIMAIAAVSVMADENLTVENNVAAVTSSTALYNDDIAIPIVNVPTVDIPHVQTVAIEVPEIISMATINPSIFDSLHVPGVELSKIEQNTIQVPMASFKSSRSLKISIPATKGMIIITPDADGKFKIEVPSAITYRQEMQKAIEFRRIQQQYFADMRNLDHNRSISANSPVWQKWLKVYQENHNFVIKKNPISYQIKMIAEANVPFDDREAEILERNLEFYKNQGYNSVLLTFNGTESLSKLIDLENLIISKGLKVFIAYSGPEDLDWSMFIDPSKLAEYLSALGEKADGIIIGWRRTALHLFIPDRPFINFILKAATAKNDKLIVLGEAYLGETANTNGKTNVVTVNLPANSSGVLINGIGFNGVDIKRALNGAFSQVEKQKRIAVIVGDRPYYLSTNPNNRTFRKNFRIKQDLEKQFLDEGCDGTITLHGDSGQIIHNGRQISSDSLCYSEAK